MDPLNNVALLQTAVLHQDLLEIHVELTRKKEKTRRYHTYPYPYPWLTEERRRLHGHYARLMKQHRVDPQSFFNYLTMETICSSGYQQVPMAFEVHSS